MKKTRSMYLNQTTESRELYLFSENTSELYPALKGYIKTLEKKYQKGVFDKEKAIMYLFRYTTEASALYGKWYGYKFTVNERYNAAIELLDAVMENIDGSNPLEY